MDWLPVVPDTAARHRLDLRHMVALSSYWFAISYLWNPLAVFILPVLVGGFITHPMPLQIGPFSALLDKNTYLSILEGIGTIVAVVWQPAIGAVSDRSMFRIGRRRPFIAIGALGVMVFLVAMTLATSFWMLFAIYGLLQLASNTAQGPYQGMLPDQVPDDQRGEASGYYGALQMIGLIASAFVIGIVLIPHKQVGWAIISIAGVIGVAAAMVVLWVPDVRTTRRASGHLGRAILLSFVLDVKRYPDFAWLMVSRLLFLVAVAGIQRFALYFLQDTFHMTPEEASHITGYLLLAIITVAAITSLTAGHLSERWGRKRLVAAACVIGAIGAGLMVTAQSVPFILAYGVVLGFGLGIFLSVDWAFATDLIPKAEAGRYMGVSNIATASAGIIAGFLLGPVIDIFNAGRTSTVGYRVLFGIGVAFFLTALLTLQPVREIKVE